MWGTGNVRKVPDTIENLLGEISESYEPRQHIRVLFYTCAIPITWFSCIREFFHAVMGVLVGKTGFRFQTGCLPKLQGITTAGEGDKFSILI